MSHEQLDPSKMTQSELRMQVVRMQAELTQRSLELDRVQAELRRREQELEKREEELKQKETALTDLRVKFEVSRVELGHKKPTLTSRLIAFIVGIFFGVTTVLFNQANSMINAKPPDPAGNTLLVIAAILYFGCLIATVFIAGGGKL